MAYLAKGDQASWLALALIEVVMSEVYRHTQIGWVILLVLGGVILAISLAYFNKPHHADWIGYSILAVLGVAAVLFSTLTVIIRDSSIHIRFGPGLIRKEFALKEIEGCRIVKTPWYYGWGIRKIPKGRLFNVSGLMSVELTMKDGMKYRIGTDDPEKLAQAVEQSLQSEMG